jgi:hypothetical protein
MSPMAAIFRCGFEMVVRELKSSHRANVVQSIRSDSGILTVGMLEFALRIVLRA